MPILLEVGYTPQWLDKVWDWKARCLREQTKYGQNPKQSCESSSDHLYTLWVFLVLVVICLYYAFHREFLQLGKVKCPLPMYLPDRLYPEEQRKFKAISNPGPRTQRQTPASLWTVFFPLYSKSSREEACHELSSLWPTSQIFPKFSMLNDLSCSQHCAKTFRDPCLEVQSRKVALQGLMELG